MPDSNAPSRSWYAVSLVLVLLAIAAGVIATVISINSVDLQPVEFPGSVEIDVDQPGRWIVCAETVDGSDPVHPRFDIEFSSTGEETVPLVVDSMGLTYTIGDRRGVGVGHADLPRAGRWTLSGVRPGDAVDDGARYSFVFGPDPISEVFLPILIGGGVGVILVTIGAGIWGLVFWLRMKALQATETEE